MTRTRTLQKGKGGGGGLVCTLGVTSHNSASTSPGQEEETKGVCVLGKFDLETQRRLRVGLAVYLLMTAH